MHVALSSLKEQDTNVFYMELVVFGAFHTHAQSLQSLDHTV